MPVKTEADNERKKDMLVMTGDLGLWVAECHRPQSSKIWEDYRIYLITLFHITFDMCLNMDGTKMAEWS